MFDAILWATVAIIAWPPLIAWSRRLIAIQYHTGWVPAPADVEAREASLPDLRDIRYPNPPSRLEAKIARARENLMSKTHRSFHQPEIGVPVNSSVGTCTDCGKQTWKTRKAAKRAARTTHPGTRFSTYRCGTGWHYGHLPQSFRSGSMARADIINRRTNQ